MRDLEIARILIEPGHAFRGKTVIVCGPNEKQLSISRLSKFGSVLPIGAAGLAAELERARLVVSTQRGNLQFVDEVKPIDAADEIDGNDFIKLILTGNFSNAKYQAQIRQDKHESEIYCVPRTAASPSPTRAPDRRDRRG